MFPWWLTALIFASYILTVYLIAQNQKLIDTMVGQQSIEIDNNAIRIKSKNGIIDKKITLEEINKIIIQNDYSLDQETLKDFKNEFTGNPKQNYIIVFGKNENRKFNFELESHYMINQLNKTIAHWIQSGLKIERTA